MPKRVFRVLAYMKHDAIRPIGYQLLVATGIWLMIGVLSGLQQYLAGVDATLPHALLAQTLAALPWIPATPLIMRFARRFPVRHRIHFARLLVHGALGVLCVLSINFAQAILLRLADCPLGCLDSLAHQFWTGVLSWGHFAFLVYGAIAALAMWRSSSIPSEPSSPVEPVPPTSPTPTYFTSLTVSTGHHKQIIPVSEIEWIEGSGDYVNVHTQNESRLCGLRLGLLEQKLDPAQFARIHRSVIVNLGRVRTFAPISHGDYLLTLDTGQELKLTRSRRQDVLNRLATHG